MMGEWADGRELHDEADEMRDSECMLMLPTFGGKVDLRWQLPC